MLFFIVGIFPFLANADNLSLPPTALVGGNEIQEALDQTTLNWSPGGNGTWSVQSTEAHDGEDALESGTINDLETIWLEAMVEGPGNLEFYWKVSSQENYDFFNFLINEDIKHQISGEQGWQYITQNIPSGFHKLLWFYSKDETGASGNDRAWLDQVIFTPTSLSLKKGWNLIASKEFSAKSVYDFFSTQNFSTSTTPYHSIWAWDTDLSNWKVYLDSMSVEALNQLNGVQFGKITDVEPGVGYWINMKEAATFSFTPK